MTQGSHSWDFANPWPCIPTSAMWSNHVEALGQTWIRNFWYAHLTAQGTFCYVLVDTTFLATLVRLDVVSNTTTIFLTIRKLQTLTREWAAMAGEALVTHPFPTTISDEKERVLAVREVWEKNCDGLTPSEQGLLWQLLELNSCFAQGQHGPDWSHPAWHWYWWCTAH